MDRAVIKSPNKRVARNAGVTPRLTIGRQWPGLPEPGRWATYMRKAKIAILVTFIIVGSFGTFALLPGPTRPNLSIKLVGSTNDLAGVQVGVVSVTNLGTAKIFTYAPCIEVRAPREPGGIACYGKTGHWGSILRGGASGFFAIPVPTNHPSWRVTLLVYNDLGAFQSIRRVFKGRRMPFDVQSDWIQGDK